MKSLVAVLFTAFLYACATPYKSDGFMGGFSETQLERNVFRVSFRGNAFTRPERVEEMTLLRSAELALKNGFTYFAVIDSQSRVKLGSFTTPTQSNSTANVTAYGNSAYGSAQTTTYGGQTINYAKPSSTNTIICFKEKPDIKGLIYNAQFLCNSLGGTYGVVCDSGEARGEITGSEGSNCVSSNAKVGDSVRLPSGRAGTIKSLFGISARCTNQNIPILAQVDSSHENASILPQMPATSKLTVDLPEGWEEKTLSELMIVGNGVLYAINRTTDIGILLSVAKREGITNLMDFVTTRRANQMNSLVDPQQSEITQITINGKTAYRFEITGALKSGMKITYMATIVEGTSEIAYLNAWTTAANYERQKGAIALLAEKINGLK